MVASSMKECKRPNGRPLFCRPNTTHPTKNYHKFKKIPTSRLGARNEPKNPAKKSMIPREFPATKLLLSQL